MEIIMLLAIGGVAYWYYKNRKQTQATQAEWVRPFSVCYLAMGLLYESRSIPDELVGIMDRPGDMKVSQPLLVRLQLYLEYRYGRSRQPTDFQFALADIRHVFATEFRAANSPTALRRYIRVMHEKEAGTAITEEEFTKAYNSLLQHTRASDQAAEMLVTQIMRFNVHQLFQTTHGMSISQFTDDMYASDQSAALPEAV
ncbi:hypothetical protein [Phyllobacterium pellucidum]|uniref:hypothetical protein n=1 Tax=Phyllobacterium pellucidum TaxID=2740464 RepID=UPI001D13D79B|nr:hypothetical protein [Phyllobacterium sp. T1018]UGY08318.1 hypothetical protein LLE51_009595 [Phyllobacterium sp. T1018]